MRASLKGGFDGASASERRWAERRSSRSDEAQPRPIPPSGSQPMLDLSSPIRFSPHFPDGEVTEWPNVPDSKSGVPQGTGGSNPSLSAILRCAQNVFVREADKG